jgi:hypothetical protein
MLQQRGANAAPTGAAMHQHFCEFTSMRLVLWLAQQHLHRANTAFRIFGYKQNAIAICRARCGIDP